jgi:peptide/nickel transport system ATP-binding protein
MADTTANAVEPADERQAQSLTGNIIEIRNLSIKFPLRAGTIHAVNNVDFTLRRGSITALVGESGSGKTTMASVILNVLSNPGVISSGEVLYEGEDILKFSRERLRQYKWAEVAMVFQAAQNALNPLMTIREQMLETFHVHQYPHSDTKALDRIRELLAYVRLDAGRVLGCYPHELSGGMKQRVMIAFALLLNPKVLILDEPTTALDVITQDYVFDILYKIYDQFKITMLLLTHDIAVVARFAQYMNVMYAGYIVESGDIHRMFKAPRHNYTQQLLRSTPSLVDDLTERGENVGMPPDTLHLPEGCVFAGRCTENHVAVCAASRPPMVEFEPMQFIRCHIYAGGGGGNVQGE